MPNYQEMYLTLMRATEDATRILIKAQQACEELYLTDEEPRLILLPTMEGSKSDHSDE